MTNPLLALESVSYVLPDGRPLFSDLTHAFDGRPTGLVGRNGVGKSVLARLLAGQLQPTSGRCLRPPRVHYLAQHIALPTDTVASLAGVAEVLAALAQIEAGGSAVEWFDRVGERWEIRRELQQQLALAGLDHLGADTPAAALSGGEAMRAALVGAFLSDADFLILDEPSNHLDRPSRAALAAQLQRWPRGLLLISHDRALLDGMSQTVELSASGLRRYGGGYAFYAQAREHERAAAAALLQERKTEQRRESRVLQEQHERQQRRQARGARQAREANQAPILLGLRKDRSEDSAGRLRQQQEQRRAAAAQRVRDAAQQVEQLAATSFRAPAAVAPPPRRALLLDALELPHVQPALRRIDLSLDARQRVAVTGSNGSGKSTLLGVIAGQLAALAGRCERGVRMAYLDQQLTRLDPQRSVLAQLSAVSPGVSADHLRTLLAQLGLGAAHCDLPCAKLSGGERLKAALACALYAQPPAQLLLLDEPGNHLDLASLEALETALADYRGALLVVSHDTRFLDRLGLTHELAATAQGWQLQPYAAAPA